ncbi:T9SS type A sorting domain-containing protein [Lacihabitans soyangensis]|uniref:T9SS C-terminal target domain-containing protein n=1 Tax=Lacihabitans soyangensis TaxID=869394 RepID=A0AAE3KQX9_9BACT|nr:T9SS type A sorting domain-containing protein [Lacihabitans soyangensis]MCP9761647.1 T9SS C-terminal target domain-containing protein [Lacihabitans soyangensis]
MKKVIMMGFASLMFLGAMAQNKEVRKEIKTEVMDSDKPGKKKVRIEKNINGKVEITEKEIDFKEGDSNVMILDEQLDTVIVDKKGGEKRVKVIVSDDGDDDFEWSEDEDIYVGRGRSGQRNGYFPKGRMKEFHFEMDRLSDHLADIPYKFRTFDSEVFDDRLKKVMEPTTIRSVDVFTNKPETNVLNIKFYAPKAGDVNITVLDLQGNVKAKEEAKNFEGEYVGQIKLGKGAKGTYFVIVSQGEDGISRKVKID